MNWAIERDDEGVPVRMWWMGPEKREPREIKRVPVCDCGYAYGWHKLGCSYQRPLPPEETSRE